MNATSTRGITRFVLALTVAEADVTEFVHCWTQLAEAAARHPANIEQWLTRGPDQRWYITSDWDDPDGYSQFSASPEHEELAVVMRRLTGEANLTRSVHVLHLGQDLRLTGGVR